MSYCPNCGREIENEEEGCPVCNNNQGERKKVNLSKSTDFNVVSNNVIKDEEKINDKIAENNPLNMARNKNVQDINNIENNKFNSSNINDFEEELSNVIKVAITAFITIIPGIGAIIGIIAGILFMGRVQEDSRSFGKALLIYSIILISIAFICCCVFLLLGSHASRYYYY